MSKEIIDCEHCGYYHQYEVAASREWHQNNPDAPLGEDLYPIDYEPCGDCGCDHQYEYAQAAQWHIDNPGSYDIVPLPIAQHLSEV